VAAAGSSCLIAVYTTTCDKTLFLKDAVCFKLVNFISCRLLEKAVIYRWNDVILRDSSRNFNTRHTAGPQIKALIHDFRLLIAKSVFFIIKQEVMERTNLPTLVTLFKNVICIKTSIYPNITLVGNSVPILKHSHLQNNVSNKRIVGSS
jgi:hypothetical protein